MLFNFDRFTLYKASCLKLIIDLKINLKKSFKVHIFLCSCYFINLRTSHCFIRRLILEKNHLPPRKRAGYEKLNKDQLYDRFLR